jgi:hypothetical protein
MFHSPSIFILAGIFIVPSIFIFPQRRGNARISESLHWHRGSLRLGSRRI